MKMIMVKSSHDSRCVLVRHTFTIMNNVAWGTTLIYCKIFTVNHEIQIKYWPWAAETIFGDGMIYICIHS